MTEVISLGPVTTLTEDIVYALPAKRCMIHSNVGLEMSNTTNFAATQAITANTSTEVAGGFVRSTTAAAIVRVVGF